MSQASAAAGDAAAGDVPQAPPRDAFGCLHFAPPPATSDASSSAAAAAAAVDPFDTKFAALFEVH